MATSDYDDLRRFYRLSDAQLADNQYDICRAEKRLAELRVERAQLVAAHERLAGEIKAIETEGRR